MLGQDDGVLRGAARGGDSCRRLDGRGKLLVGELGSEREVKRTQLVVGDDACELAVELAPLAGGRLVLGRCGE